MTHSIFIREPDQSAAPIHAMRPGEWAGFIETRAEAMRRLAAAQDFRAQAGRILIVPATDGAIERVLFGLGEASSPLLFGALAMQLPAGDYKLALAPRDFEPRLIATAWGMGAYVFDRYKTRKRPPPRLVMPDGVDADDVERVVAAVHFVRDLVNTPTNDMGCAALHAVAEDLAKRHDARFSAIVGDALITENYPLIHAVGRAAAEAPRLLHIGWGDPDAPRLAIVGKGVTFDSGGLDIKSDAGMRLMKKDMGGAAHALALARLVMEANLPVRLDLYTPVVENAISGSAFRPGDVIKSRKGLTVEIDNTDAEGRLILADALTRACEDKPDLVLDYATLTGAARVALGADLPPMFANDDPLADDLLKASAETADPLWRMPLWKPYDGDMDSAVADLKNTGDAAMAGSIYGALFLQRFVAAPRWAHFDVYAWSQKERPARPAGGDANALRASWRMLQNRYGAQAQ
ncbi:MAG: leucyl aminopeptidase family protein [Alphaproteobacteria bacterium]|nr:leucyl aminopeptidase family protein [Alphaproteobacteria bacterium]